MNREKNVPAYCDFNSASEFGGIKFEHKYKIAIVKSRGYRSEHFSDEITCLPGASEQEGTHSLLLLFRFLFPLTGP